MYNLSQKLLNWYHVPMVVRIRFGKGFKLGRKRQRNKRLALVLAALLPPSALAAALLAVWRVAADLNWTNSFAYCDERGSNEYNLALGQNRADAAKNALVTAGVAATRIRVISLGKEKPFCTESTEECWHQNRRAGFTLDR